MRVLIACVAVLGACDPEVSVARLSPSTALPGAPEFTLTVAGTGFVPGSEVHWGGSLRSTTFVSSTELQVPIRASDVAAIAAVPVTVMNPDGATSNAIDFQVSVPAPKVRAMSPRSAAAGDPPFTLTIAGSGFVPGTVVQWNGAARPTSALSSSVLHASIQAADVASAGSADVAVFTPAPGGGTATAGAFTITPMLAPTPPPQAATFQIDPGHTGHVDFGAALSFPSAPAWSASLPGDASYPLIAGGKVFVLSGRAASEGSGARLHAFELATGAAAWGPIDIAGGFTWAGQAYESGELFVINSEGLLRAFDATTGAEGWISQMPGAYSFDTAPTAAGGVVYVSGGGSGEDVFAVDEGSGAVRWRTHIDDVSGSSPAVGPDGLFVSFFCRVYKLDLLTGSPVWHANDPCDHGGGMTVVYARGAAYVRDFTTGKSVQSVDAFLDTLDGSALGGFRSSDSQISMPALGGSLAYFKIGHVLVGQSPLAQEPAWRFSGDGRLSTVPIVIGEVVVVGSESGTVYALDGASGAELWSASVGSPIPYSQEQGAVRPLTGLGAGEGYLVVPAGRRIVAWRLVAP